MFAMCGSLNSEQNKLILKQQRLTKFQFGALKKAASRMENVNTRTTENIQLFRWLC